MASFAEIDNNNIVVRVLAVADRDEHRGQDFLANDLGLGGRWIQTSYNTVAGKHLLGGTPFRKNYAGVGYVYDEERDAFYEQQPYPSWTLNEETCQWEPPIPKPIDTEVYYVWNEEELEWKVEL